jgi:hypothetical protein
VVAGHGGKVAGALSGSGVRLRRKAETIPGLSRLPSTAAPHEPENNEKQDRTNRRLDDRIYNSNAEVNAQAW